MRHIYTPLHLQNKHKNTFKRCTRIHTYLKSYNDHILQSSFTIDTYQTMHLFYGYYQHKSLYVIYIHVCDQEASIHSGSERSS